MKAIPDFSKIEQLLLITYILCELVFLILIQTSFILVPMSEYRSRIMYAPICLNTLVTLYYYLRYERKQKRRSNRFLAFGLFITCLADYFLTLHNEILSGYLLFCLVELIYAVFLGLNLRNVYIRLTVYLLSLAFAHGAGLLNLPHALGLLNLSLLSVNVICAWINYSKQKELNRLLTGLAFSLFAGCDYSILIMNLTQGKVMAAAVFMIWIFYIPSQVLLVTVFVLASMNHKPQ